MTDFSVAFHIQGRKEDLYLEGLDQTAGKGCSKGELRRRSTNLFSTGFLVTLLHFIPRQYEMCFQETAQVFLWKLTGVT